MNPVSRRGVLRGLGLTSLGVVATTRGPRTAMAVSNWDDTSLAYESSDGGLPSLELSASDLSFEFAYSNFPSGPTTVDVTLQARSPSHDYGTVLSGSFSVDGGSSTKSVDGKIMDDVSFPIDLLAQGSLSESDFTASTGETQTSDVDFRVKFLAAGETTTVETTCTVEVTNTSSAIPDSGVARWELEQDATDSWGDNSGTVHSGTYTTNAQVGSYALDLNGSTDWFETADSVPSGATTYSMGAWVYPRNEAADEEHIIQVGDSGGGIPRSMLVWRGDHFSLYAEDGGSSVNNDGWESGRPIGQWYLSYFTRDGSDFTVYVGTPDGAVDSDTMTNTNLGNTTDGDAVIAGRANDDSSYLDAIIDDPRRYNKGITETEFRNLLKTGSING